MSSAFPLFVLFVSFVVEQFCAPARATSLSSRPFVALTQAAKVSRHQGILVFTLCVLRALGGENFCFARRRDRRNSLRYPLETARRLIASIAASRVVLSGEESRV